MNICKKLFCCFSCCTCCKKVVPLKNLDDETRLLPQNVRTKKYLEKNELYLFGQIPEEYRNNNIDLSKINTTLIKKIVCGLNHCLILFNDNQLYVFGANDNGQLGLPISKENNYINQLKKATISIPELKDFKIIDIAAGENFSFLLAFSNNIYYLVKLSIRKEDIYSNDFENIKTTHLIDLDYNSIKISNIYAFGQRLVFLTISNDLYINGMDFNHKPIEKYKLLEHLPVKPKDICLGLEHCLILDINGTLYSIGDNTYGELGYESVLITDKLIRIKEFPSPVDKIAVGARHSLILLKDGDLYAFGDNSDGQCTGFTTRYPSPVKISFDNMDKIIDVYSGYNHCLIILDNGEVYSWGDTTDGKLGYIDGSLSVSHPKIINLLKGKYIDVVCLSFQMTIISTSSYENSIIGLKKNRI